MPPRHGLFLLLLLMHLGVIQAEEPAVFTPPQAYPASRYEAGWGKNPFTLKTVAPVAAQDSFVRDLAIGAHYGAADNPTVVIVNTKTNERIPLRKDQPGPGGMRLRSVRLSSKRNECQVEVVIGSEAALLTYDAKYLGQLAAAETSRLAAAAPARPALVIPSIPLPGARPSAAPATPAPAAVITSRQFSPPSAPARPRFPPPKPQ